MRAIMEYHSFKMDRHDKMWYLDIFLLIEKNRMTREEVTTRKSDNYRNLAYFLAEDEAAFLMPLVGTLTEIVSKEKPQEELNGRVVYSRFISPLSLASRESVFDNARQVIGMVP